MWVRSEHQDPNLVLLYFWDVGCAGWVKFDPNQTHKATQINSSSGLRRTINISSLVSKGEKGGFDGGRVRLLIQLLRWSTVGWRYSGGGWMMNRIFECWGSQVLRVLNVKIWIFFLILFIFCFFFSSASAYASLFFHFLLFLLFSNLLLSFFFFGFFSLFFQLFSSLAFLNIFSNFLSLKNITQK